jgi:hypothetical protein
MPAKMPSAKSTRSWAATNRNQVAPGPLHLVRGPGPFVLLTAKHTKFSKPSRLAFLGSRPSWLSCVLNRYPLDPRVLRPNI